MGGHRQAWAAETWICLPCMQGEAVAKDIAKAEGTGKQISFKPTRFHPIHGSWVARKL